MTATTDLDRETRARLSRGAILAYMDAIEDWNLDEQAALRLAGQPPAPEYRSWCDAALDGSPLCLGPRRIVRIAAVASVHISISKLLPEQADRVRWFTSISRGPACRGAAPVDWLSQKDDMVVLDFSNRVEDWLTMPWLKGATFTSAFRH